MHIAAGILFVVSAVAEIWGVLLVVSGIRAAKRKLDTPIPHVIDGGNASSTHVWPPRNASESPEVFLLEAMERQWLAVALLVVGIVTGTVGNFLTLPG